MSDGSARAEQPGGTSAWAERWALILAMPLAQVPNMALAVVVGTMREDLGLSYAELGMVIAAFSVARLVAALPAGTVLQRLEPRPTLLVALAASLAAMLVGFMAPTGWMVALTRVVYGVGSSVVYAIVLAWLLGAAGGGGRARARVMAMTEAAFSVVALVAPLVAGGLAAFFGWRGAFILGGASTGLALMGVALLTRSDSARRATGHSIDASEPPQVDGARWSSLRVGGSLLVIAYLITLGVFFSRQALLYTLLPVIGTEGVGLSPAEVGVALALLNGVGSLTLLLGAWLAGRLGSRQFILTGMLMLVLPQIGLFFITGPAAFMVVTALQGLSSLVNPVPTTLLGDALPPASRAQAIALYRFLGDVALLMAPLVVGLALEAGGFRAAMLAVALPNTLLLLFVVGLAARHRSRASDPQQRARV